jgi:hypothetical protein
MSDSISVTFDSPGTLIWTRQFGTSSYELLHGITTDANGDVYAIGYPAGALEGANAGDSDALVRSYDSSGTLRWSHQFGTSSYDIAQGVVTDADGNVNLAGVTEGGPEGASVGSNDGFIRKYRP